MATPTAIDVSGRTKGRFRRACTRVFSAFAGALLVFSVSTVASQGILGSIQGLIDYFVPTVFAVLFGRVANACVADDNKRLYEEFQQTFDPFYAELTPAMLQTRRLQQRCRRSIGFRSVPPSSGG